MNQAVNPEKGLGFAGQRHVSLAAPVVATALRHKPLLRGLLVTEAGFFPRASGHLRRRPRGLEEAILIYCVQGSGWAEIAARRFPVRSGHLLIIPPGAPHAYGADVADPWTIHWLHAVGEHVPAYLEELGVSPSTPTLWLGEDLQLIHLFGEIVSVLEAGMSWMHLHVASHTLAYLLARCLRRRHERSQGTADGTQKVAQAIIYMSDHLDKPPRMTQLAALANFSPAHFTTLFRKQTGCPPREYLQLLRIHRACQLLYTTTLSIKEIAARVGYADPLYFSRQFKAVQGMSPTDYRARKNV